MVFAGEQKASKTKNVTLKPAKDSSTPLYGNPYMGWVLEYNTIEGLPYLNNHQCRDMGVNGKFYPEFDVIEILSSWGDIERQEGVLDWSRLDAAVELWSGKGKKIRLRVSNDDLGPYFNSVPRDRLGSPDWLYTKYGVDKQIKNYDGASNWQFPNIGHPTYQVKLKTFLTELANKYKTHPAVEAVSIRGYGAWGEWHDGYSFRNQDEKASVLRQMLGLWTQAWAGGPQILSLPVSIDCDGADWNSPECSRRKNDDYAGFKYRMGYDQALDTPMLTFNKDCVGACTAANEYSLMDESFRSKKLPLIGEFGGFYKDYKNNSNGRNFNFAKQDVLKQKLNYITALGWSCDLHDADDFYSEQKTLINSVMMQLGYRLSVSQVVLPEFLTPGNHFTMNHSWKNEGVGRFYGNVNLKIYLVNPSGVTVWEGTEMSLDLSDSLKGSPDLEKSSQFVLPGEIPAGSYQLKLAVVEARAGSNQIKLAMKDRDVDGRYLLGTVAIKSAGSGGNTYFWSLGSYSSCSKACGGGTQSRSVVCQNINGQSAKESLCPAPKPEALQSCNTQSCGGSKLNSALSVIINSYLQN